MSKQQVVYYKNSLPSEDEHHCEKKKKLERGECSKRKNVSERIESSGGGGNGIKGPEHQTQTQTREGKAKVRECKKRGGKGGPENDYCSFRGVRQKKSEKKWMAEICVPNSGGQRLWLGSFDTAIQAALAYDAAVRDFYGPSAYDRLNIPGYNVLSSSPSPSLQQYQSKNKPSS